MPIPDWQTAVALVAVAIAVAALGRRLLRLVRDPGESGSACGGGSCDGCGSRNEGGESNEPKSLPLVTLSLDETRRVDP